MSLSLAERVASLFKKQPPQEGPLRNSEIINPADSAIGQAGQTVITPLVFRIEPETPPVMLDENGQIIPQEAKAGYSKVIRTDPIINPARSISSLNNGNTLVVSDSFPRRDQPLPKIIRKLIGRS